jgi:hypothetical protein
MPRIPDAKSAELKLLFDPNPSMINISMFNKQRLPGELLTHRLSDFLAGFLILADYHKLIPENMLPEFTITFDSRGQVRSDRQSAGQAFLGPDGLPMVIKDFIYSGDTDIAAGQYNLDNVSSAPDFEAWFIRTFFHNGTAAKEVVVISDDEDSKEAGSSYSPPGPEIYSSIEKDPADEVAGSSQVMPIEVPDSDTDSNINENEIAGIEEDGSLLIRCSYRLASDEV